MRLLLFIALTVGLAFAVAQTAVYGETSALIILDPADPYTVQFGADRTASIGVTVRNASGSRALLGLALFDAARNETLEAGTSVTSAVVSITDPVSPGELAPGQVRKLDVKVEAGSDVDLKKFKGVLIARATDLSISAATLTLVGAAPSPFTGAKTQPTSVTMTVTRCHPSLVPWRADCWIPELFSTPDRPDGHPYRVDTAHYQVTVNAKPTEPLPKDIFTDLSSDTGGHLRIALMNFEPAGEGLKAVIRLGDGDRAGKYTGKILLDPSDDKAPTVDVTVNVQDLVAWPLLFVIAGALAASRLVWLRDHYRPRKVAQADLSSAYRDYQKIANEASDVEKSWMRGLFPPKQAPGPNQPTKPKQTKELEAAAAVTRTLAEQLALRLRKPKGQADLDNVVAEIADLTIIVSAWPSLRTAAGRLTSNANKNLPIDKDAEVFKVAKDLLTRKTDGFTKSDQAKAFLADLNDQVAAIEIVQKADEFRSDCLKLWKRLSPERREALALLGKDPEVFWNAEVRRRGTKQELMEAKVISRLIEILGVLLAHVAVNQVAIASETAASDMAELLADAGNSTRKLERVDVSEPDRKTADAFVPIRWTSPEVILARIRVLDKRDFLVSAGIAVAVFVIGLYADKNFGTFWNYFTAVLAGLSGALVINWQLLPWYRKYTSVVAAKV